MDAPSVATEGEERALQARPRFHTTATYRNRRVIAPPCLAFFKGVYLHND